MYLSKLLLRDFGKFHNKEISLKSGLNVICGDQDAGKTTIRDFITGMFFGIHRRDGFGAGLSEYDRRKPENRSNYSGSIYLRDEDKTYLVDRSFLSGAKKTSLMEVKSGREVRLANPETLTGTVLTTDRNTYRDTQCISGEKTQSAKELARELSNLYQTGSPNLDIERAISYLEAEKKKHVPKPMVRRLESIDRRLEEFESVDADLEKLEQERRQLSEDFIIEAEKRKRVARRMVENEDGTVSYEKDEELDKKIDRITRQDTSYGAMEEDEEDDGPKLTDRLGVIIAAGILVIAAIAVIVYLLPFDSAIRHLFIIFTALFVVLTIVDGLRIKGYFDSDDGDDTPSEEEFKKVLKELETEKEKEEELEFDMTFAKEFQEKKAALAERENQLLEKKNERERLKAEFNSVFKKKSELEDELTAIGLAASRLRAASEKIQKETAEGLFPNISEFLPILTANAWNGLIFDETGSLLVTGKEGTKLLSDLDDAQVAKVTLAVRLAVAKYFARNEAVPLVLDDAASCTNAEDYVALARALMKLRREQIILLTSDRMMRDCLMAAGMELNYAEI